MGTMFTDPTFDELRTLISTRELRAVITSDGHTAVGNAAHFTHLDLRTELLPMGTGHQVTMPSTTSELLLFRTNELLGSRHFPGVTTRTRSNSCSAILRPPGTSHSRNTDSLASASTG